MAKIFVFHWSDRLTQQDIADVMIGFCENHHVLCANLFAKGGYDTVAILNNTDDLDRAFEITNHIDSDWDSEDMCARNHIQLSQQENRSTSVGDILGVLEGNTIRFHVVSLFDFKDITDSFMDALKQDHRHMPEVINDPTWQEELNQF